MTERVYVITVGIGLALLAQEFQRLISVATNTKMIPHPSKIPTAPSNTSVSEILLQFDRL